MNQELKTQTCKICKRFIWNNGENHTCTRFIADLDNIPKWEIIEYVLENYYDEMREAIQEQAS